MRLARHYSVDWGDVMGTIKRTEITIETHRMLVIGKRGSLRQGWCTRCLKPVGMIRLEEAALAGVSLHTIRQKAAAGRIHFTAEGDSSSFICLNSLLE